MARLARQHIELILGALLALGLTLLWAGSLESPLAWGWDETVHAQLNGAGVLFALQEGDFSAAVAAVQRCDRYPFGFPLVLACGQALLGVSEWSARVVTTATFGLALFGVFLIGRELRRNAANERGGAEPAGALALPWLALACGALSPLAIGYSGTVFLEVPFLCVASFSILAWMRRCRRRAMPDLLAGALLTAAFFTKFNYGVMLWAGLALDAGLTVALAGEQRRAELKSLARVALVPLLGLAWWFGLPVPGGLDMAQAHRTAFLSFLQGNTGVSRTPDSYRAMVVFGSFFPTARFGVLALAGVLISLFRLRELRCSQHVRTLACAGVGLSIPVFLHGFFLDRFLVPIGAVLWPLAAAGWARLLPARAARAVLASALALALVFVRADFDAPLLARGLGVLSDDYAIEVYQRRQLASWRDLSPSRSRHSAGLRGAEHEQIADLISAAVGPEEHVGWIGTTDEFSSAATHLALVERGGARRRFLADAHRLPFHTFSPTDPGWTIEVVERMAAGFDVLLYSEPVHMKRGGEYRAYMRRYRALLVDQFGWEVQRVGGLQVHVGDAPRVDVELFALRRPAE